LTVHPSAGRPGPRGADSVVTNRTGKDEEALTPEAEEKIKGLLYNEKLKAAVEKLGEELRRKYKVKILVKDYDRLI
jgi:hypothetical protein